MLSSKSTKLVFLVSFFLLFIPISLYCVKLAYAAPKVNPDPPIKKKIVKKYYPPTRIVISKVEIDLPIEQATIKDGVWEISEKGASYLTTSARPGEKGLIVLYGHNTNDRLGPIRWLKEGDMLEIETADRKKHSYKISETMTVARDRMDIFEERKEETLIIYTCDGYNDVERFVIFAEPAL